MSDIFISYAREDEPHAKRLAQALTDVGWSVWWDRDIPAGQNFDQVIEEQMRAARCVVVIWSARSVASQWVRGEAFYAFERRTLVPVRIDDAEVPFVFRQVQTADLVGWDGSSTHVAWTQLRAAIMQLVADTPGAPPRPAAPGQAGSRRWGTGLVPRRVSLALVPVALAMVAIAAWSLSGTIDPNRGNRIESARGFSPIVAQTPMADHRPTPTPTPVPVAPTKRVLPTLEPTLDF